MTLPTERHDLDLLICDLEDLQRLPEWFSKNYQRKSREAYAAFEIPNGEDVVRKLRDTATDDLARIMDRFRLWTPKESPQSRQRLIDALFESLALQYDDIVSLEVNRENIRNLMRLISNHFHDREQLDILDFGCGSGVSAEVKETHRHRVLGFDRCPAMRARALERGVSLISRTDFDALAPDSFDAVFASYVMHLTPSVDDVQKIWSALRREGLVVANFHKDQGLQSATKAFLEFGASQIEAKVLDSEYGHGTYCAYLKK